jgi:hypothetical protein
LTESTNLLLQVSFLNAFNRHLWNRPVDLNPFDANRFASDGTTIIPGGFGTIQYLNYSNTGGGAYLNSPRKIQLQLKFEY